MISTMFDSVLTSWKFSFGNVVWSHVTMSKISKCKAFLGTCISIVRKLHFMCGALSEGSVGVGVWSKTECTTLALSVS